MSILIGHASVDENGKIAGGQAGDQTSKEVCTRQWYDKSWNVLIRCKDSSIAELIAKKCEEICKNNNIGYDQKQRNTLYKLGKQINFDFSKIATKCECDCSALVCTCAIAAGINEKYLYIDNNMRTTRNMKDAFEATGQFEILTDSKYLTSDKYLKRGDILLKEGSHTIIVLENSNNVSNNKYVNTGIGYATSIGKMNVRISNKTSSKKIGSIGAATKVEVLKICNNGWYKIVWPQSELGYAYVSNVNNKYFRYKPKAYNVKINVLALNVRSGAGTSFKIKGILKKNKVCTIVEEKHGWGRLQSGAGWISLKYTKRL